MAQEANFDSKIPIFLDYQSTTKVDPRVLEVMLPYFSEFSNPHSRSHVFGWKAEEAVENARQQVAHVINANAKDIIFTSGATESNNMAIKGCMEFYRSTKDHMITVATEHKCVLDSCRHLEESGIKVTYLSVKQNGLIDLDELESAITEKTALVSVMAVNNEIGIIQPLKEIGEICKKHGVFFHTDAAQAYGKIPLDVEDMNISLLSVSGHKMYAPMGVGALYVRRRPRVRITPLFNGGGQERGMRSGTLPTPLVVGLGKAAEIANQEMEEEGGRLLELRNLFYTMVKDKIPDIIVNGDLDVGWPGNLNISFPYVEGESIIMAIKQLAVSSGSACTSASLEPSYVLRAIGVDEDLAHSSIRFGFGRFTTKAEVIFAANLINGKIMRLREMSPLWEMVQDGIDLKSISWSEH